MRGGGGGGGGGLQARGGGAVRFRPDMKSGGWGMGGGVLSGASGPILKAGRGCLAEEGELSYMKGGVATPNPPPPLPPPYPPLHYHWAIPLFNRTPLQMTIIANVPPRDNI